MRGLLHVEDLVHRQGAALAETLAALATFERLLFAVDIPMIPEVVLPSESLAANIARVRPLVRVSPLVNQQIVRFRELSIAELTDELFLGSGRSARCSQQPSVQVLMGQGTTGWVEGRASGKGPGENGIARGWF